MALGYVAFFHSDPKAAREQLEEVKKQRAELKLTIPVLDGSGLHNSYGVAGTPKLMVLDGNGVVRGDYVGWGAETPGEVLSELSRWAPKH